MDLNDLIKNPEQIKSMITLLEGLLKVQQLDQNTDDEHKDKPTTKTVKTKKFKTANNKKTKSQSDNKFERMAEFNMHKNDIDIDRKLTKNPPVARMREFELVDVVCRVCGKKETISPSLVLDSPSRYKCNNCATQAG